MPGKGRADEGKKREGHEGDPWTILSKESRQRPLQTKLQIGHGQSPFVQLLKWQGQAWIWESETWVRVLVLLLPGCLAIFSTVKWGCHEKHQVRPMVQAQKMESPSCHNLSLRLPK